jgi:ribosomal protein S27E
VAELRRRISQLADLADRMELRERGRQGQLIVDMVEVLRELALDVEEVSQNQLELEDYLEEIDSDLMSVEEELYVDDDEHAGQLDDKLDGSDAASYIELECPVCERESSYNQILFDQDGVQLTCPHCGNVVFDSDEDCLVLDDEEAAWDPNDTELFD